MRSSALRNSAFATHTTDIITILNEELKISFLSPAFFQKTGFEETEVIGLSLRKLIHPRDWPAVRATLTGAAQQYSKVQHLTLRFRKKAGEYLNTAAALSKLPKDNSLKGVVITAKVPPKESVNSRADSQKLAILTQFNGKGIVITDRTGTTEWVNEEFTHMTGYTFAEAVGRRPGSLLQGPLTDPNTIHYMQQAVREGKGFLAETINYRKDGTTFWMFVEVSPIQNQDGQVTHFIGLEGDVTEQKKHQDQLFEQLTVLNAIQDSMDGSLFAVDHELRYTSFNAAHRNSMKRTFGVAIQVGMPVIPLLDEWVNGARVQHHFERALQGEHFTVRNETGSTPESKRYIEISYYPIRSPQEGITGVAALANDITPRVRTEQERDHLLHELLNYKHLLDKSTLVAIFDREGKIAHVNELFCAVSQYSREELLGQPYRTLNGLHPDEFFDAIRTEISQGKSWQGEICHRAKGGSLYWVEAVIYPVTDENGESSLYFALHHDITERKQTEDKIRRQNEELKKINAQLDQFVYSVSHDLKAPLASIAGLITIAQLDENPTSKNEYMDLMRKSVTRLDHFIRDIIDFARNSRTEITWERIRLGTLIDEICQELSHSPDYENISRSIEVKEEAPFFSDARRLSIVLNNLLSNAVRYSDLRKEAPCIEVAVHITASRAYMTIADNGIGIEPEHRDKIFNMFYRATEHKPGSGLGLFIVKETVAALGGTIWVESAPGEGTTFAIELPNQRMVR